MAEKKNPGGDDPRLHSNEPNLSHSPDSGRGGDDDDFRGKSSSGGLFKKLQNIGWVKKNPNLAKGAVVGVLLLVLLGVVGWQLGWFGGGANKPRDVAAQPQQPAMPPDGSTPGATPGATPAPNPGPQAKPVEKKPEVEPKKEEAAKEENPELSDDVTKWKRPDDLYRARKENHPKLLDAVVFVGGEKFHGSDRAAQALTELLKPLEPEEPTTPDAKPTVPGQTPAAPGAKPAVPGQMLVPGQMPPGPGPMQPTPGQPPATPGKPQPTVRPPTQAELTKLVETIIGALGENGSDAARKTLEQVLSGKFTTDDDKVAVEATLKTLVAHACLENDMLLLRVLMTPEAMRPADRQGPWPAKEMRAKAFELVKANASPELRAKLAESLADRLAKLPSGDPIRDFLLAPDPRNAIAQAVLYEKASGIKEVRIKLEQQLTSYSSLALGRLMGLPEGAETGTGGAVPAAVVAVKPAAGTMGEAAAVEAKDDPHLALQLAGLLWSEKFCEPIETQFAELRSLERQTNLIVLAATIPQDSIRVALAKLLRKRWNDGPKLLETAGLFDRTVTDPALLLLLKLSPRKDPKAGGRTAAGAGRGKQPQQPARQPAAGATGKVADAAKANQKKEQAELDWMSASTKLTSTMLKRFYEAAQAKDRAETPAGKAAAPKLPSGIELNEGAKPVTSFHVLWPDEITGKIPGGKPSLLEVYYVRVEELNKPRKVVNFYSRQLQTKPADAHLIDNKAVWIDGRLEVQGDRRRSADVWITRADDKASETVADEEETDLIVELLVIEIKDPIAREGRAVESKDE